MRLGLVGQLWLIYWCRLVVADFFIEQWFELDGVCTFELVGITAAIITLAYSCCS